jgi:PAS domain S-box-containing protein
MKAPAIPTNEAARLTALLSYEILDTGFEELFDDLTRLTASILDVPIALITLIDADRQWFKSRYGLDVAQTPRELSFCGHVVALEAPLVVADAFDDDRFADNPFVTGEPRVRFYAGMPIRTPDGFVLGSLCAIDHVPRQLTPHQLEMLALLARKVVGLLEARRERHQLAVERAAAVANVERFSVLFEAMAEGVVQYDRGGVIATSNGAAERILGLTADEMGRRVPRDPRWGCIHEDGTPFLPEAFPATLTRQTGSSHSNVIMGVCKSDGELTWVSINTRPLRGETDAADRPLAVLATFHDITEIKAAQAATARLARQEHLVTMGTLVAGIAHEINNPLTFIHANIEFAVEELRSIRGGAPPGDLGELVDVLGEAREGADRVRKIVRALQALTREEAKPIPTDIEESIDISIDIAAHELRSRAKVVKHLPDALFVLADRSRLSQVLVNLLVNAAQAFTTSDVEKNRITVTSALEPDGRVSITVGDNGPGIPPNILGRVFDPFFTTRPIGAGAGLGLSISQSILRALGGEITVASTLGEGTTFRVFLPVAARPPGSETAPPGVEATVRGRVLAVDDEPVLLNAIRRALEREHEVVAIGDPREALKQIESGERFDVVFCDLMMPHLGGDELHARVLAIDPALAARFVFVTGGVTEGRAESFLSRVPNERIEKPFNLKNLRDIARRFVNARAASR